ncbi:putative clathrin heavy chain protein 1 [Xenorhabdus szentirmaii DSM 16338]|uniref:Clathrin heavy chain protein 1 n=1 Tax=Xenorhabdus szentirmaii DSM 16338 TaxID=1427518 RepID=W1IVA5_9GAMM|nr:putative clathrin heavy chain protein 1 [Xenorhabdus szentirmaii DSM 16338]
MNSQLSEKNRAGQIVINSVFCNDFLFTSLNFMKNKVNFVFCDLDHQLKMM